MPLPDNALDRLRAAFVSTDAAQGDGAPALRLQATGTQSFTSITLSATNAITFSAASAEIIPGATSLLFRNNADNATNLSITDAGLVTARAGFVATTGGGTFTAGNVGIGVAPTASIGVRVSGTTLATDADQSSGVFWGTASVAATSTVTGVNARVVTAAASFTAVAGYAVLANAPVVGAGSAITTQTGFRALNQGATGITNAYGAFIEGQSGAATVNAHIGLGGTSSGIVSVTVAAAAGTWTFTLPPDDGDAGEQLQTNGSGVTTWEAAGSMRQFKNVLGRMDPREGLRRILAAPVYDFTYRRQGEGERITTTGDHETRYAGVMADEAPWAMHHNGRIFSPVSAFGHAALAIQALQEQIDLLKRHPALA